ncbi:MAG: 3D domain-containing protein [Gorillibacterium sp.]|nr:3D domain-containing protein [Gorillibacterium sp.]
MLLAVAICFAIWLFAEGQSVTAAQGQEKVQRAVVSRLNATSATVSPITHLEVKDASAAPPSPVSSEDGAEEVFSFTFLKREHFQAFEVMATGYYAGRESTGKSPGHPGYGITFSGVKVRKATFSTVAADTKLFPLGTILYIPGYGYGVVADTGNAIKGNKIDLYFETKDQVYELWGKKKVQVSVLRRGDGWVTEEMLDQLNGIKKSVAEQSAPFSAS